MNIIKVYPNTPPLKPGMRVAVEIGGMMFVCVITSRHGKDIVLYNRTTGSIDGVIKYDSALINT